MPKCLDAFRAEFGPRGHIYEGDTYDERLGLWCVAWRRATAAERERLVAIVGVLALESWPDPATAVNMGNCILEMALEANDGTD